jgi:hypothetical protein
MKAEIALRDKFDQREFHDLIIAQGLLPPRLLERAVLAELGRRYAEPLTLALKGWPATADYGGTPARLRGRRNSTGRDSKVGGQRGRISLSMYSTAFTTSSSWSRAFPPLAGM